MNGIDRDEPIDREAALLRLHGLLERNLTHEPRVRALRWLIGRLEGRHELLNDLSFFELGIALEVTSLLWAEAEPGLKARLFSLAAELEDALLRARDDARRLRRMVRAARPVGAGWGPPPE